MNQGTDLEFWSEGPDHEPRYRSGFCSGAQTLSQDADPRFWSVGPDSYHGAYRILVRGPDLE